MFLLILHESPVEAALLVPDRLKHKQLLELMQMLSCILDFGYKQIPQGKEIKEWIKRHKSWVYVYAKTLLRNLKNLTPQTIIKYKCLIDLLGEEFMGTLVPNLETAIFRYSQEYEKNTIYKSNSELLIQTAIDEYKKYLKWKESRLREHEI